MPKVKGMRLGRLTAQAPTTPQQVTMPARRVIHWKHTTVGTYVPATPPASVPRSIEWDVAILATYKREMRACQERACECMCHCHAGDMCLLVAGEHQAYQLTKERIYCPHNPTCNGHTHYVRTGQSDNIGRFHYRAINTSHKSAHRECNHGWKHHR